MRKAAKPQNKKRLFNLGLVIVIGILIYFKYTNFFITSLNSVFIHTHAGISLHTLNILLPLGISFYTFRILSYMFDVRNGKFEPVTDWVVFFSYISFFPSVVSGPIDRPKTLVPQLEKERTFDYAQATDGLRQILWGLFKKVVIADNCAMLADFSFDNHNLHGIILIFGAFFYAIQLYADFSGYSDMAIGIAKLLGFNITRNFNNPYFAQNIADHWRRWHMSLTSWLTEYIFTPVSIEFRDYGKWGMIIAIMMTFLVSGFWHGANWTFVIWGLLYGCYFIPLILMGKMNKKKEIAANKKLPSFSEFRNILATFLLVMFTDVLFRSESLSLAFRYYRNILNLRPPLFAANAYPKWFYIMVLLLVMLMFCIEWIQRDKQHALQIQNIRSLSLRWGIYIALFFTALYCIMTSMQQSSGFIYVKF